MAIDRLLTGNISRQVKELMATEDLVVETFRDLVKDELKAYVRDKIEKDEELEDRNSKKPCRIISMQRLGRFMLN